MHATCSRCILALPESAGSRDPFFSVCAAGWRAQVINIYYNETVASDVCTCCRICEGWLYVPGAQIFAACTVGDGTNSDMRFKTSIAPKATQAGKFVTFRATATNVAKKKVMVSDLTLAVELPSGLSYSSSKGSDNYVVKDANKGTYGKSRPVQPVFNATTGILAWTGLNFPPHKSIRVRARLQVNSNVPAKSQLVLQASLYQTLSVNGLPFCSSSPRNHIVTVK